MLHGQHTDPSVEDDGYQGALTVSMNRMAWGEEAVDFEIGASTITFSPGETSKDATVSVMGSSEHDRLVAFGFGNASNCQPGGRNVRLLRISAR